MTIPYNIRQLGHLKIDFSFVSTYNTSLISFLPLNELSKESVFIELA
jgi:hypothetical protein